MFIHKLLLGENAALYLPFGLAQLRQLARMQPKGYFSRKFYPTPDVLVWVEQKPPIQYVTIIAGGAYFEFLTSGKPVETFSAVGSVATFTAYKAAVVSVSGGKASIAKGRKAEDTVPNSPLGKPNQVQLIDEPVSSVDGLLLYDSYAPVSPHTGVWLRSYADISVWTDPFAHFFRDARYDRGPTSPFTVRDIDFDIPFMYGRGKTKAKRAYVRGDADWPRANAIQTVTDDAHGSRTFGIYNDAFGQFFVFPIGTIEPLHATAYEQNVPEDMVQSTTPDLPSWVFQSTQSAADWYTEQGAKGEVSFPEIDWKFKHDGTKCCAVVFERRLAVFDSAYYGDVPTQGPSPVSGTDFTNYRDYYTGALGKYGATFFPNYAPDRYSIGPGIVEVTIEITLTGSGLQDFTVRSFSEEIRRPSESEYFTVLAGYSWHDIKAQDWTAENKKFDAKAGDMVALDLEKHYKAVSAPVVFLSLKNLTQDKEIRAFPGFHNYSTPTEGTPTTGVARQSVIGCNLVDYDLPTLSFVLRTHFEDKRDRPVPLIAGGSTTDRYRVRHFGLSVFTLNRYRETLYPETVSDYARGELEVRAQSSGRDLVADNTFTRLPMNEMRTWSNTEFAGYRDWYMSLLITGAKSFTPPSPEPSTATRTLFEYGLGSLDALRGPMYITDPCTAWNEYANWFLDFLHLTEQSTFFAHKSGAWALYDQQYVYNRHGIPEGWLFDVDITKDTLTPLDVSLFEHCIFDRVHLPKRGDTTFRTLYNEAVAAGVAGDSLVETFQPVELIDLRAVFSKNAITSGTLSAASIGVTWGGVTGYYLEATYMTNTIPNTSGRFGNAFGWLCPSLGDYFSQNINLTGSRVDFFQAGRPIKFSSVATV